MCGIIGYIGERPAQNILLNGLKRLEYRGYDSSGIACLLSRKNAISIRKSAGKISVLENLLRKKSLSGSVGVAHTRWATHGAPNQINAHPHSDCKGEIAVVHNGIIENYRQLKAELVKEGHQFVSQTDTEVIVHLIEKFIRGANLEEAVFKTLAKLEGSFAIAVISQKEPEKLIGAKLGSPLIVGLGKQENFLASDAPAILEATREVIFLEDKEVAILDKEGVQVKDFNGKVVSKKSVRLNWDINQAQKQGYPHFMLKEINEQPKILEDLLGAVIPKETNKIAFEGLDISDGQLSNKKNIAIVACGTAYHAGLCGKYIIEEVCKIPVSVDLSSEFRYRNPLLGEDTLVVAISQSGETADTLAAVREAKKQGACVLAICNVLGASLVRECDGTIYTHAGPEIGVASTKAYTAQLAILYLFALYLAGLKRTLSEDKIGQLIGAFKSCPHLQKRILEGQDAIKKVARRHSHFGSFLFLGRNINY
ncbi:MAG: glutamine--fructose-6-phosphate transaminase (isomerizing), partial [Candidatus Omnitrophota bacterium]